MDRLGPGGEDNVLWFKNWVALQSVRALERTYNLAMVLCSCLCFGLEEVPSSVTGA